MARIKKRPESLLKKHMKQYDGHVLEKCVTRKVVIDLFREKNIQVTENAIERLRSAGDAFLRNVFKDVLVCTHFVKREEWQSRMVKLSAKMMIKIT